MKRRALDAAWVVGCVLVVSPAALGASNLGVGDPGWIEASFFSESARDPVRPDLPSFFETGAGFIPMHTNIQGGVSGGTSGTSTGPVEALTRITADVVIDFINPPELDPEDPNPVFTPLEVYSRTTLTAAIPAHVEYNGSTWMEYTVVWRTMISGHPSFEYRVVDDTLARPGAGELYSRTVVRSAATGNLVPPGSMTEGVYDVINEGRIALNVGVNQSDEITLRHEWRALFIIPEPTSLLALTGLAVLALRRHR